MRRFRTGRIRTFSNTFGFRDFGGGGFGCVRRGVDCADMENRRALGFANAVCAAGALSCLAHGAFDMELHIPSTMIAFGLMCVFSFLRLQGRPP